jgi:hypothetical protein
MSNASAASRAATHPKAAPPDTSEPELPLDHPERAITALFTPESPETWKLAMTLGQRLAFATYGVSVADDAVIVVCTLPITAPTPAEQSRFRLAPEAPRLELAIPRHALLTAFSAMRAQWLACEVGDAVAALVAMRLEFEILPPRGARPFIARWLAAVQELAITIGEMWWQGIALATSREAVHRARVLVRAQAVQVGARWLGEKTGGGNG